MMRMAGTSRWQRQLGLLMLALGLSLAAQADLPPDIGTKPENVTLPPVSKHWVWVNDIVFHHMADGKAFLIDGDAGRMLGMLSTDQVWVFGPKYLVVAVLLSVAVGLWLSAKPAIPFEASGEAFPLWILHGVAFLLLPSAIQLPGYHHAATFLSERISLFGACLLLLCLAQRVPGSRLWAAGLPLAGLFFSFLYVDGAAYNNVEAQVTALARSIPPGQRVVAPIYDRDSRIQPLLHVIDRACLSHCYSYGNYQPATGQFRLQAVGENPLVAWNMADVQAIEDGSYIVPPAQAPIHALCPCESQTGLCVFKKAAGERTCASTLSISPGWW